MTDKTTYEPFEEGLRNCPVFWSQDYPRAGSRHPRKQMWESLLLPLSHLDGMICEFGVWEGNSLGWFAKNFPNADIYGFDSFEGLPEDWGENYTKGHFTLRGKLPQVTDPHHNVQLQVGLFSETLPSFIDTHRTHRLLILHLDADLYSSTKEVLENMCTFFMPGTILLFDELCYYDTEDPEDAMMRAHEYRAFMEFCQTRPSFQYEFIGRTNICQAAVKILAL